MSSYKFSRLVHNGLRRLGSEKDRQSGREIKEVRLRKKDRQIGREIKEVRFRKDRQTGREIKEVRFRKREKQM